MIPYTNENFIAMNWLECVNSLQNIAATFVLQRFMEVPKSQPLESIHKVTINKIKNNALRNCIDISNWANTRAVGVWRNHCSGKKYFTWLTNAVILHHLYLSLAPSTSTGFLLLLFFVFAFLSHCPVRTIEPLFHAIATDPKHVHISAFLLRFFFPFFFWCFSLCLSLTLRSHSHSHSHTL